MRNTLLKRILLSFGLFLTLLANAPAILASGNEFDKVCDHLEKRYDAKKVKIPFMWLARAAVGIVRPAGVKSFKVTIYRDLNSNRAAIDEDMRAVMSNSFSDEWTPIVRMRSKKGNNVYINMREDGRNVRIFAVTIDDEGKAVVVRARFNPEKLVEFLEDPEIFGISLGDSNSTGPETEQTPHSAPDTERESADPQVD
ncbi:MAG: DUF4252 domain-containing protein [Pyrinomonadaceae bacterium]